MSSRDKPTPPPAIFEGTAKYREGLIVGIDVGSTTVKAVVVDPVSDEILWKDYQRHDTKQPEKCLDFLRRISAEFPDVPRQAFRLFMTGSGGSGIGKHIGAKFVQEVNAVSLAVEKEYPEVQSVVELGGQDAKIIVFKEDPESGKKKKIPSMNDKCAGGTGAVIDKINAKLKIPADKLCEMGHAGLRLHPVAGKCGVFAETDINGLQKQGVPPDELMASLFESIIQQNLSVLTRGHTLRPTVMLLGGPNCYIKGMREAWYANIPPIWAERGVELPAGKTTEELIIVPDNAQYFAAIGAVEFAKIELEDNPNFGVYLGTESLEWYLDVGRIIEKQKAGAKGLSATDHELSQFKSKYTKAKWSAKKYPPGSVVRGFVGVDGGSTSTKAVLVDHDKEIVCKAYQLSKGNPIEDTMEMFAALEEQVTEMGCTLEVEGVGTTGYAKDILKDVLKADVALVETVAHTEAGLHFYPGTDVIVDVGGQDIKVIILNNGQVKDFKLNTQCSAGNGYFLQSTAAGFGHSVYDYADLAFSAKAMPEFGYGCAVFMQSDIVDFQRQGWRDVEIMAGLAAVLPKNIWLYVSQIPNLPKLGSKFLLQGGTQHNLAAVKSQVDFISSRFKGTGIEPEILVHMHCGESGAIGCAFEAHRMYHELDHRTDFIGLERVRNIGYRTTRDENTRCYFCKNKCLRTFIDVRTGGEQKPAEAPLVEPALTEPLAATGILAEEEAGRRLAEQQIAADEGREDTRLSAVRAETAEAALKKTTKKPFKSKVPMQEGEQRLIIATCEKGEVEDIQSMRSIKAGLDEAKKAYPNLVDIAAHDAFKWPSPEVVADEPPSLDVKSAAQQAGKALLSRASSGLKGLFGRKNKSEERKLLLEEIATSVKPLYDATRGREELEKRRELMLKRKDVRIGFPRVLNMYSQAPFFLGYFGALGLDRKQLVFSDFTNEELYKEGAKRGAIDPCFPSKLGIPHVHNLLMEVHKKKPLTHIFFPMVDSYPTWLHNVQDSRACPTVVNTAEATHAAFTKESDLFNDMGIVFKKTFLNLNKPQLAARQMYEDWADELGITEEESYRAMVVGLRAMEDFYIGLRRQSREVIDQLEQQDRVGVVLLARSYHNDPGVNHEICDEFQKLGYPVLWEDALPLDEDLNERLFGEEIAAGEIESPFDIGDVWKNSYSENTSRKVWAAKYTARHPNLVALELSSFKCGHDAPIYTVIEEIIENSGTPYFCFKDIDENKPSGAIKIRIETIAYFLRRHREKLVKQRRKHVEIDRKVAELEARLRRQQRAAERAAAAGSSAGGANAPHSRGEAPHVTPQALLKK
ncbi:MAG: CoA activase [Myxococcales bacterium]|nr:CoA activase [Myxococcales bacterium]